MPICKMNPPKKIGPLSWLEAEEKTYPSKPDGQTDIRTDISNHRVASLLKMSICYSQKYVCVIWNLYKLRYLVFAISYYKNASDLRYYAERWLMFFYQYTYIYM